MSHFISKGNPEVSGLYKIDRDKQGIAYRYYDAKKKVWARPDYDPYIANELKGTDPLVGFFPWVGPLTLRPKQEVMPEPEPKPRGRPKKVVAEVKVEEVKVESKPTKNKKGVKVKMSVGTTKTAHSNGTVFYREDRKKWVVMIDSKQPCARPTPEGCIKWLKKKYPDITPNILR